MMDKLFYFCGVLCMACAFAGVVMAFFDPPVAVAFGVLSIAFNHITS